MMAKIQSKKRRAESMQLSLERVILFCSRRKIGINVFGLHNSNDLLKTCLPYQVKVDNFVALVDGTGDLSGQ